MTNQNAADIAKSWASGLSSATNKMQAGIQAVKTAPGQAAARQKTVWAQNVAASQDKWAASVSKVSLNEWQTAMINKGLPRVAQGATQATDKFAGFMGRLLPYEQSLVGTLPARGNLEQNIARAEQMMRGMSKFQNT